jgi:hypothetical protein
MRNGKKYIMFILTFLSACLLSSCATLTSPGGSNTPVTKQQDSYTPPVNYASRLPQHVAGGKQILVDPNVHAWGAYDSNGNLIKAGLATAGSHYCKDLGRPCRTRAGTFHIQSLGNASCKSTIYPLGKGGAPMPYCMFFNGNQGLHGSPYAVEGNVSHGCVRMHVSDADWVRFNFATVGTKVVVRPY